MQSELVGQAVAAATCRALDLGHGWQAERPPYNLFRRSRTAKQHMTFAATVDARRSDMRACRMQTALPRKTPVFRKTTESFTAGARTLPQRYFVSPEVFAEEQSKIFGRHWICVGHQSQLDRPGDYFVQEVAGESLVMVRDQKGAVRGFYNVCRHRGTRLCEESSGHCAAIQCPYHAWTYALDGRLIGAPHMDTVPGFEKVIIHCMP